MNATCQIDETGDGAICKEPGAFEVEISIGGPTKDGHVYAPQKFLITLCEKHKQFVDLKPELRTGWSVKQ